MADPTTTNYGLTLPQPADNVDVNVLDSNFTSIDAQMKTNANAIATETTNRVNGDNNLQSQVNTNATNITNLQSTVEKTANKNVANGYAGLDNTGHIASGQIPSLSGTYVPVSAEGQASGVATLDSTGKLISTQLNAHDHSTTTAGGQLKQVNTHLSPDTDTATTSLHHTLGTGANQAATGNHNHSGTYATVSHTHTESNITNLTTDLASKSVVSCGLFVGSTNSSSYITVNHTLGSSPSAIACQMFSGTVSTIVAPVVTGYNSTQIQIAFYNSTNGAALPGNPINCFWIAFK